MCVVVVWVGVGEGVGDGGREGRVRLKGRAEARARGALRGSGGAGAWVAWQGYVGQHGRRRDVGEGRQAAGPGAAVWSWIGRATGASAWRARLAGAWACMRKSRAMRPGRPSGQPHALVASRRSAHARCAPQTSRPLAQVCDFNISRLLADDGDSLSTAGIQNPRWLAPEVLGGQAGGLPAE